MIFGWWIGDPTDASIPLRPLEPASGQALARDLVLKTRRRKGLGDQIAVSKYLDDEFVVRTLSIMILNDAANVILTVLACPFGLGTCRFARLSRIENDCKNNILLILTQSKAKQSVLDRVSERSRTAIYFLALEKCEDTYTTVVYIKN